MKTVNAKSMIANKNLSMISQCSCVIMKKGSKMNGKYSECHESVLRSFDKLFKLFVRFTGDYAFLGSGDYSSLVVYFPNRNDVFNVHGNGTLSAYLRRRCGAYGNKTFH